MNTLHAVILGALQGLTEILPISSSAHLILIPRLLGWPESGLTFDVALHLGTLIALCIYFRSDIVMLFRSLGRYPSRPGPENALPLYILLGTIPAALAGKLFEHAIEDMFRNNPLLICIFLMVFALLLAAADRLGGKRLPLERMTLPAALVVGVAQCLALVPGVSRSGITITAALFLGFSRESSARFSFLLSLPVVAGAALLKLAPLRHGFPPGEASAFVAGTVTSALFGYASVAVLLRLVKTRSLAPFVWYRLAAGIFFLSVFIRG